MQPAVPDEPPPGNGEQPFWSADDVRSADDVGAFAQGTAFSRWALARYLVGQAILTSVSQSLLVVVVVALALAAVCQWVVHVPVLTVLLVLFALGVLFARWLLRALVRRFTDAVRYSPVGDRLGTLLADARGGVRAELRRLRLPSHTVTLPLLALRLIGKRRAETISRLKQFDTARAVPASRVDELHMLLRSGDLGGPAR